MLAYQVGRYDLAVPSIRRATELNPLPSIYHSNLGLSYEALGKMDEALACYHQALRVQPDFADAHNNLESALADMPGRLPDAIDEFAAAVRSDPDFVEAHLNQGNALAEAPGRMPEAIAEYETALRIRPDPEVVQMVERLRARRR